MQDVEKLHAEGAAKSDVALAAHYKKPRRRASMMGLGFIHDGIACSGTASTLPGRSRWKIQPVTEFWGRLVSSACL